jgi:hypothetical protein
MPISFVSQQFIGEMSVQKDACPAPTGRPHMAQETGTVDARRPEVDDDAGILAGVGVGKKRGAGRIGPYVISFRSQHDLPGAADQWIAVDKGDANVFEIVGDGTRPLQGPTVHLFVPRVCT